LFQGNRYFWQFERAPLAHCWLFRQNYNVTATLVEICIDSVESARAAQAGGAHRIELCSDLRSGGITPSGGLIAMVRKNVTMRMHVLIRPRAGDFVYSHDEFEVMKRDILLARQLGVNGIVLGILQASGGIDVMRTRELVELARPLSVTFHRAFDATPDFDKALEAIRQTGAVRILTSGGAPDAASGIAKLAYLVEAGESLTIMPGGGVRVSNVARILNETHAREVHTSLQVSQASAKPKPGELGQASQPLQADDVAQFVQAVQMASEPGKTM
jgi:copper homeostasis protein